ncbi:MAG: hypothetical protein ACE5FD_05560 [Anaerolineae bacterium]
MIETKTIWDDSGFDCDHCGGEVSRRTDKETGLPDKVCYQCMQCGCQWKLAGDVQRVGHGRACAKAARERAGTNPLTFLQSPRVMVLLGIILLLVLIRFGGFGIIRPLIPLAIIGYVVYRIHRYGQERMWW